MSGTWNSVPDRLAASAARGITRRRALRNLGGAALGAAVTTAYLGTRPDIAEAICEVPRSRCGPAAESPICGSFRCRSNSWCDAARADTAWRKYGQFYCPGTGPQCWNHCYNGVVYSCCDCAGRDAPCGTSVSGNCGSGSPWRACICVAAVARC